MIYLLFFCISVFFAHLAKRSKKKNFFIFYSIVSIALPVLLAGLRNVSIGIDTSNYYEGSWTKAMLLRDVPIQDYIQIYLQKSFDRFEILFGVLIGFVARTTGNYQVFLTLVHLIIITCVYIGAFRMKKHVAPELTLLLFYLLYYGKSLNIYRQYMAMAILFAVTADLEERKHLRYIVFTLIASLIHNSALIGFLPLLIFRVLYPSNSLKQTSIYKKMFTCAVIFGGVGCFIPFVRFLMNVGILSSKYQFYLDGEQASSYKLALLFIMVEFVGLLVFYKGFIRNNTYSDFYFFSSVAFLVLYIMGTSLSYGGRIAAYLSNINIVSECVYTFNCKCITSCCIVSTNNSKIC